MNPIARGLLGAAIGALVTLCLHPKSRPFMLGVTSRASPDVLRGCLDSSAPALSSPTTLSEASLWMQLAASKIARHEKLSAKERSTILQIATRAEAKDRANAFWPQMEAVFNQEAENLPGAIEAWRKSSFCPNWDDFQTNRLLRARGAISDITGVDQAWQLAYVYYSRSEDVSACLRSLARMILSKADYDTPSGLELRYATLLNGDLLRKKAHSSKSSINAMEIVDLSTFPSDSLSAPYGMSPSPKRLTAGEMRVVSNFTTVLHKPDWTQTAEKIFKANEAWRALTVHDSNEPQTQLYAISSVLTSSVAGAVVVVAMVGVLIWTLGRLVAWRLSREKKIKPYAAVIIALVFGGFVLFLTGDLAAAFAASMCAGFLAVAPDRSRNARPSDLGPLFSLTSVILGVICSALLTTYLVGTTPAANAIFPNLGIPAEYFDKPLVAGIAAVCFGLVLLTAPIWAVVNRLGTPHVLSLSLMKFGAFISLAGLSLSIVLGPLSVYADQKIESTFLELVQNEPDHYYVHQ